MAAPKPQTVHASAAERWMDCRAPDGPHDLSSNRLWIRGRCTCHCHAVPHQVIIIIFFFSLRAPATSASTAVTGADLVRCMAQQLSRSRCNARSALASGRTAAAARLRGLGAPAPAMARLRPLLLLAVYATCAGAASGARDGQRSRGAAAAAASLPPETSPYLGESGKLWRPDGPFPDFRFAGYRFGASRERGWPCLSAMTV